MAREVTIDERGLATGVLYIDRRTGQENHVLCRQLCFGCHVLERRLEESGSLIAGQGMK